MDIILINSIFYIIAFIYYYRKDKGIDVFNYLILFYAGIAIMGVIIVNNGIYGQIYTNKQSNSISIIPYIFCFFSYLIFFYPYRNLSKNVNLRIPTINHLELLLKLWVIVMTAYCILKGIEASISISMGLGDTYSMRHNEGETIFDYSGNIMLKRLNNLGVIFQECTVPFIVIYCIDSLKKKTNRVLVLCLLILCFLPNLLSAIGQASRGQIFSVFIKMLFFIVLFRSDISSKIKKYIVVFFVSFVSLMFIYSVVITESRLEGRNSETPIESIARYFGESFPNLGYLYWEKVENNPMGERLFPELYGYSVADRFVSTADSYSYWERITHVPILNFKTLFGDLYIEFDFLGALLFVVISAKIFSMLMSHKITYYNVGIAYFYFQICSTGFAGITRVSGFNLIILAIILIMNYGLKRIYK